MIRCNIIPLIQRTSSAMTISIIAISLMSCASHEDITKKHPTLKSYGVDMGCVAARSGISPENSGSMLQTGWQMAPKTFPVIMLSICKALKKVLRTVIVGLPKQSCRIMHKLARHLVTSNHRLTLRFVTLL